MTNPDRFLNSFLFRCVVLFLLAAAGFAALLPPSRAAAVTPQFPQDGSQQASPFLGPWCAQGNPNKHASISSNGGFLTLTNENGDTAAGTTRGPGQIVVPQWQFVSGTLSGDGSQINWSNGTFWARCYGGGGGGGDDYWHRRLRLTGTWYANGDRSKRCSIQQRRDELNLQNEVGQGGSGSITGRDEITTNWSGTTIRGHVSHDGNRIDWDNGTYWIRYRLYTQ